ncbi:hypothetical protein [Synechocystis sp. LKSZ1]|uniref:hypothetical protein n=1 Tax=Synechocystis sp. LKSZ1 TaxID=3144951 RepID=UPI00336BFE53
MFFSYVSFSVGTGLLALIAFFILQWLQIPAGNLVDWLIGIASFWWLLAVVTIPWNIYFEAEAVKAEAATSREKNIPVDPNQLKYVRKVARWSLVAAITLHLLSALGLYYLASSGISAVGYVSAFATLLLTFLRPAVRFYQYLAIRLTMIRQEIQYPREDVLELRGRVNQLESTMQTLETQLDPEREDSLVAIQKSEWERLRREMAQLRANLEQFQASNDTAHQRLAREAEAAIAQLTEDSQVLNHVREIIRFWKQA